MEKTFRPISIWHQARLGDRNCLRGDLDRRCASLLISLDFSLAFNTINYVIIPLKCYTGSVRLSGRSVRVMLGDYILWLLAYGIPHRSHFCLRCFLTTTIDLRSSGDLGCNVISMQIAPICIFEPQGGSEYLEPMSVGHDGKIEG